MRRALFALGLGAVLASCAAGVRQASLVPSAVAPAPYDLKLQFSSDIPDEYYVTSGPGESYGRFRVNDRLRAALEEYLRHKSGPPGGQAVVVRFHLISVRTHYDQMGVYLQPGRQPRILLADSDSGSYFDEEPPVPREITKQVDLTASVEMVIGGRALPRETFTVTSSETIDREHHEQYRGSWPYDYSDVVRAVLREAVGAVDRIVTEAMVGGAKA